MKNKMIKTVLTVAMCMSIVVTMAGCGNSSSESAKASENTQTESTTEETTTSESDTEQVDGSETTDTESAEDTSTAEGSETEMEVGTYPDGSSPQFSDTRLKLTIDGQEVIIRMYDNTAVDDFLERLPLENLEFSDLSGIEKPVDRPEEPFSLGDETPGYDPVTGDMVIYRPWGNFTIFYGDFRHSDELVPLGHVESGLDIVAGQTDDFTGTLELAE